MTTTYPTALDALVNPASTDAQNVIPHAAQHANANDAIEALQAKVGINSLATGEANRSVQAKLKELIHVADFGAVGDGVTNDYAAITAALAAAAARGGGVVMLEAKIYAIASKISIPSGCGLVGKGCGQYPSSANATQAAFEATRKTRLLAMTGFPALTPMVDVNITRNDQYCAHAVSVRGIMIDCANIADIGMQVRGTKNSAFSDLLIYRPTGLTTSIGLLLDTGQGAVAGSTAQAGTANTIQLAVTESERNNWYVGATISITSGTGSGQSKTITGYVGYTGTVGTSLIATVDSNWSVTPNATSVYSITGELVNGFAATQFNSFRNIQIWLGSTGYATGIVSDGDNKHDVNQNDYANIGITHADGPGIRFYNGDTESFRLVRTYSFGIGAGAVFYGNDNTNNNRFARSLYFTDTLFGGANAGGRSATAQAGAGLTITLDAGASAVTGFYNEKLITITSGTGSGQVRRIDAYTGGSKVALVSPGWTTNPDSTSVFSIPNGGGCVLRRGAYRASNAHIFNTYQYNANGATLPQMEDDAFCTMFSDYSTEVGGTTGHIFSVASHGPFGTGSRERIKFRSRLGNGQMADFLEIRNLVQGASGTEGGRMDIYARRSGAAPALKLSIGDGITLNGGIELSRMLRGTATLDFPSVAAGGTQTLTITVTGAVVGDGCVLGLPSSGGLAGLVFKAHVSAADTVTVTAINGTAGALDPASAGYAVWCFGI